MVAFGFEAGFDYYDVDIYYYECGNCRKEIKNAIIWTCLVCKKKICRDCHVDGFCLNHYNMLSSKGKEEFNQLVNHCKKNKRKISLFGSLSFITWFTIFIIFLSSTIIEHEFFNLIWLPFIVIILFIPVVILMVFWARKEKTLNIQLIEDKVNLFERQKEEGAFSQQDTIFSELQKYCLYCERELKLDAIYCDKCGRKHS